MSSARVSKPAVREILEKYLDDKLAEKIFWDIVEKDELDAKNVIGMTYKEWNERFDDDREVVWAADTKAGFGKKGDSVYGDLDDCIICCQESDGKRYKLWVWCEALTTDEHYVNRAVEAYKLRHGGA